jgi:hypothetical protein
MKPEGQSNMHIRLGQIVADSKPNQNLNFEIQRKDLNGLNFEQKGTDQQ